MDYSILFLAFFNIVLGLLVAVLWFRSGRTPKDDPRLSRGLQLLQAKIAVIEDLSDRTDRQVQQLVHILEEKARGLSQKIIKAEEMIARIDHSSARSQQIANTFEDKIPHEEVIERQTTARYVQAAQLAHQGKSAREISEALGIPESEAHFIVKVNKDELSFDESALPDWAKGNLDDIEASEVESQMVERVFTPTTPDLSSLDRLTESFNQVVGEQREIEAQEAEKARLAEERLQRIEDGARDFVDKAKGAVRDSAEKAKGVTNSAAKSVLDSAGQILSDVNESAKPMIQKVRFPRVDGGDAES